MSATPFVKKTCPRLSEDSGGCGLEISKPQMLTYLEPFLTSRIQRRDPKTAITNAILEK